MKLSKINDAAVLALFAISSLLFLGGCAQNNKHGVSSHEKEQLGDQETLPAAQSLRHAASIQETNKDVEISIAAVGDIMLSGRRADLYEKYGYSHAFAATRHLFEDADVSLANLEMALTDGEESLVEKQFRFKAPAKKVAAALSELGLDLVSLANNHSLDYGIAGLMDTTKALHEAGIGHHGAGLNEAEARKAAVIKRFGRKIGFLAYSNTFPKEFWADTAQPGTAFGHEAHIVEDVQRLKREGCDWVVVSFHWGRERDKTLREYQPKLAYAAIDAGATLVVGHHPHVVQAIEAYGAGLIIYSLGNYTFGSFSNNVDYGLVAKVNLGSAGVVSAEFVPINVNNFQVQLQPRQLNGAQAEEALGELQKMSAERATRLRVQQGRAFWESADRH